jgi:hypothetical protein
MIEIIDFSLGILTIVAIISFIVFWIIGAGCSLQNLGESKSVILEYLLENIYFKISGIIAIVSFILIFSLNSYINKLSRNEISEKVENLKNEHYTLFINNRIKQSDSLITAIKNIKESSSERNTGSKEIFIKMKFKNETINLKLLRDFSTKTKYWVFYNNYNTTSNNCVGEINTNSLYEY